MQGQTFQIDGFMLGSKPLQIAKHLSSILILSRCPCVTSAVNRAVSTVQRSSQTIWVGHNSITLCSNRKLATATVQLRVCQG